MSKLRATITIDDEACKECSLCIPVCPVNVLALSTRFNSKGLHPVELVGKCVGCELCYLVCPDFVFEVYREPVAARKGRTKELSGAPR
jgi:2-oxoglutarate ferredoxin oxidoreductase subunit delta